MPGEGRPTASRPASPATRLRDVVRAEVTKALTAPVVPLAGAAALVVGTALCALASADVVRLAAGDGVAELSDVGALMVAPIYLLLVIPVHMAGSEHTGGQLRLTLAAVPDRVRLVVARLAALFVVTPVAAAALLPGRRLVAGAEGLPVGAVLLDGARWTAASVLMGCVAHGLATLLRSRVAPVAILVLVPLLLATGVFPFPAVIKLLPDQLALSLLGTPGYDVTALPSTAAAALLAAWAAALLVAGSLAVLLRDS